MFTTNQRLSPESYYFTSTSTSPSVCTSVPMLELDYGKKRKEVEDFPLNVRAIRVNGNSNNVFVSISGIDVSQLDGQFVVEFQSLKRMLLCSSIASKKQNYDTEFSMVEPSDVKISLSNEITMEQMVEKSLNGELSKCDEISKAKNKDDLFFMYNKNKHEKLLNKFDIGFSGRNMYFISKSKKYCDIDLLEQKFPVCFKPFLQNIGSSAKEINIFKFNVNVYKIVKNTNGTNTFEPIATAIESEPFTIFGKSMKGSSIKRIIEKSQNPMINQYLKSSSQTNGNQMQVEELLLETNSNTKIEDPLNQEDTRLQMLLFNHFLSSDIGEGSFESNLEKMDESPKIQLEEEKYKEESLKFDFLELLNSNAFGNNWMDAFNDTFDDDLMACTKKDTTETNDEFNPFELTQFFQFNQFDDSHSHPQFN